MTHETTKILQIIPAEGWLAHYRNANEDDIRERIVCFALVEVREGPETRQEVRPMSPSDVGIDFCQNTSNFAEIRHENAIKDEEGVKP